MPNDLTSKFDLSDTPSPVTVFPELTERERTVALATIDGASRLAIAEALGITVRTVDVYKASVLKKLKLKNSLQLVVLAFNRGYMKVAS